MKAAASIFAILFFVAGGLTAQTQLSTDDKKVVGDFEKRLKRYVKTRESLRARQPKLPVDATPEQIQTFETTLQKSVQAVRVNTRPGDIFSQQISRLIKPMIGKEFTMWEKTELRQTVLEADTKGVPLKVNIPYPDSKELVEMPPDLLLSLPQLPKELRYRFIGRSLAILDRDNALILDFMRDALP